MIPEAPAVASATGALCVTVVTGPGRAPAKTIKADVFAAMTIAMSVGIELPLLIRQVER